MDFVEDKLTVGLKELGLEAGNRELEMLRGFYENLIEWNKVMNLTAITDREEVYEKHFLDSLSMQKALPADFDGKGMKLIDVGTGAGFPGMPIAIFYPALQVTLMDSLNKRTRFLQDTVEKLHLTNVEVIHSRAEDLARNPAYREQFDLCASRAVANLATLSEYCLPFIKTNGLFISYKAEKGEAELEEGKKAIAVLGGKAEKTVSFLLPETDYGRILIPIRKIKSTPKRFPRKAGVPSKEPIR